MVKNFKSIFARCCSSRGFTLIELSIVIVIIGLLTAGVMQMYSNYIEQKGLTVTQDNIDNAQDKIMAFQQKYGFFPCPAERTPPGDIAGNVASNCNAPAANGNVSTGGVRIGLLPMFVPVDVNGNGTIEAGEGEVIANGRDAFDGYNTRLTYAVTENMAKDAATYAATATGSVQIEKDGGAAINAPFIILSHGQSRQGGYTASGARITCDNSKVSKFANCDDNAVFAEVTNKVFDDKSVNYMDETAAYGVITSGNPNCAAGQYITSVGGSLICMPFNTKTCSDPADAMVGIQPDATGGYQVVCAKPSAVCPAGQVLVQARVNGVAGTD